MAQAHTYIIDLRAKKLPDTIGSKAYNLRRLVDAGFLVPRTFICLWEVHQAFIENNLESLNQFKQELSQKIPLSATYAVRSSANLEDQINYSFAGQFTSFLDVEGVEGIFKSACNIWALTKSPHLQTYFQKQGLSEMNLRMAVLIQEMVKPVVSGVAFSRNPVTGADEVVIEAVTGSGISLVQAGSTPLRWVHKGKGWISTPQHDIISSELILEVVNQTRTITKKFGTPVDLEWVFDGQKLYWVQMREITSLKQVKIYSNQIAKDVLPGMICPLVWSINIPIVNSAWIEVLTEMIGPNDLQPEEMARAFYFRTYFEMGSFRRVFHSLGMPEESLEMMMGIRPAGIKKPSMKPGWAFLAKAPRLLSFIWKKAYFDRRIKTLLPPLETEIKRLACEEISQANEKELLQRIDHLVVLIRRMAYLNINAPLILSIYSQLMRRRLKSSGLDYDRLDVIGDLLELKDLDPATHLLRLNQAFLQLDEPARQNITTAAYQEFRQLAGIEPFRQQFDEFLRQFGHLSDSGNDFSVIPWREQPELVLKMITQNSTLRTGEAKIRFDDLPLPTLKRALLRGTFRQLRKYWSYREKIGSRYTFGYSIFRVYYLALAHHLVNRGIISKPEDIFYLTQHEVRAVVAGTSTQTDYTPIAQERRAEMELSRDLVLPSVVYGDEPVPIHLPVTQQLLGTPTSGGVYTGKVKVVRSIQEWHKVEQGCVLVVPYSDIGWTPIFMKAGALISESGGILSHGSIIAREFGIPAVVSVENATQIADDSQVTVDGYQGTISVH